MEALAQAKQIKEAHTFELLKKRNVVGVGLGYKVSQGVNTGELGLIVSVTRKVTPSALSTGDLVPTALAGVKTDVVETGVLRAFPQSTESPEATSPRDRWRPVVPPGVSIGHYRVTAGTFGCLVQRGDEHFILSNNHVMANVNNCEEGDLILQPGAADGGVLEDQIATLADYVPIDFGAAPSECPWADLLVQLLNLIAGAFGSSHMLQATKQTPGVNRVDAALARPLTTEGVSNEIIAIGAPTGIGDVTLGTEVQKVGRTTGYTKGAITQLDATLRIDYGGQSALFSGQMVAGAMSQPGDSGSAVLDMEKRVVGLLFAGSEAITIINPIDEVLDALEVELAL